VAGRMHYRAPSGRLGLIMCMHPVPMCDCRGSLVLYVVERPITREWMPRMSVETAVEDQEAAAACWCCGRDLSADGAGGTSAFVRLGNHPEVTVCLNCAHFLHHRARQREDELRPSAAANMRGRLRGIRETVIRHDLHRKPVIGPALRWLGRHTP
jgi:hypothetical protein